MAGTEGAYKQSMDDRHRNQLAQRELVRLLPPLLRSAWLPLATQTPAGTFMRFRNEYASLFRSLGDSLNEYQVMQLTHQPAPQAQEPKAHPTPSPHIEDTPLEDRDGNQTEDTSRCLVLSSAQQRVYDQLENRAELFFDTEFRSQNKLKGTLKNQF